MDIVYWQKMRETLPSMEKEDLFIKYAESAGTRDRAYLWEQIKKYHDINKNEFVATACAKFVDIAVANPALYDFVLDTDYEEYWNIVDPEGKVQNRCRLASEFFIPWVAVEVPRSIALEVVYGYGLDIYGEYRKIPTSDPFNYFVYKNELFAAIAERGLKTIDLLENKLRPRNILFLAAGMAPEFRHLSYELKRGQKAILVDNDKTINVNDLLSPISCNKQITYIQEDLIEAIKRPELKNQDVIIANGIMCYLWQSFPQILATIKGLLKPRGSFIFELYPKHWEWARNRDIKGYYLPLKLFDDCLDARIQVEKIALGLGIDSNSISSYQYYDDFKNEIMILFKVTMPK